MTRKRRAPEAGEGACEGDGDEVCEVEEGADDDEVAEVVVGVGLWK